MKKKAQVNPMELVIWFIILAVAAAVIIYMFTKQTGGEKSVIDTQIASVQNANNALPNLLNTCPKGSSPGANGCTPTTQTSPTG